MRYRCRVWYLWVDNNCLWGRSYKKKTTWSTVCWRGSLLCLVSGCVQRFSLVNRQMLSNNQCPKQYPSALHSIITTPFHRDWMNWSVSSLDGDFCTLVFCAKVPFLLLHVFKLNNNNNNNNIVIINICIAYSYKVLHRAQIYSSILLTYLTVESGLYIALAIAWFCYF